MAPRKPAKPKHCQQRGACKQYEACPYNHDINKCRTSPETPDGTLPLAVD